MIESAGRPGIFAVPVGCDFTESFVSGLLQRFGSGPPEELARVVIYAGSPNGKRELAQYLETGPSRLLPQIRLASDLIDDLSLPDADLPPPMTRVGEMLTIRQLVRALLEQEPDLAPVSAAVDLAESLLEVFSELQDEGIEIQRLLTLDVGDQSGHWERSLGFLNILAKAFGEDGILDRRARLRTAVDAIAELWAQHPPDHPVIVAGSTGSTAPMMRLMESVANMPGCAVVLPCLDTELSGKDWARLEENDECPEHPQSMLARFCRSVGALPQDIPSWADTPPANPSRNRLISLALRPAPFTDCWMEEGPGLAGELDAATGGISLIEAASMKEEAQAIAVAIREAVEQRRRVALVTENLELARRVKATLRIWQIEPDDRIGDSMQLTSEGIFLRLSLEMSELPLAPHALMSILKHPLTQAGDRKRHEAMTRSLEHALRRRPSAVVDHRDIDRWAADGDAESRGEWASWLSGVLRFASMTGPGALDELVERHVRVASASVLGSDPEAVSLDSAASQASSLWGTEAGKDLARVMSTLSGEAAVAGTLSVAEYAAIFRKQTMESKPYGKTVNQKNVVVWGGYQVRDRIMDLVVLGNLNEGVWPPIRRGDVWLNRAMRRQIGLGLPERQNGLAAHDFQQAVSAPEIILSRALRDREQPTVASRWLTRFNNLVGGLGPEGEAAATAMKARGDRLLGLGRLIARPERPVAAAPRPAPNPPLSARPKQLSATEIQTLVRNPYAIYARHVLKLRPLDHIGREPDARERGIVFHKIMEEFVRNLSTGRTTADVDEFMNAAERMLEEEVASPSIRMSWFMRLGRVAEWLVTTEARRNEEAQTLGLEVAGRCELADIGMTLTARADRIDRDGNGRLRIFDYKSGKPPTTVTIKKYDRQLQIMGAMAARGGFAEIAAAEVSRLEYIGLGPALETRIVGQDEDGTLSVTWQELQELLGAYMDPGLGYEARGSTSGRMFASDYDHLSRHGEWSEADDAVAIEVGHAEV